MTYNNDKIVQTSIVTFIRKDKTYNKKIYYIMTNTMKECLKANTDKHNQFFIDITYYAIPRNNDNFKLCVIMAFNKENKMTELCSLVLIKNENVETIVEILTFLQKNYNFNPTLITSDCALSFAIAIKKTFPQCIHILCYYHVIKRIILHLKELKSKNKELKRKAKNLLSNIKLLLFVNKDDIEDFFIEIKKVYFSTFKKFIKYFYKNFFIRYPFNNKQWNYNVAINNNIFDIDYLFLTNNIVESTNRTLNINYIGSCKSFNNFEYSIHELFNIFKNKKPYVVPNMSTTRALAFYAKTNNITKLITFVDIKEINNNYSNYLKNKKISIEKNESDSEDDNSFITKKDKINLQNDYSSNYESSSSVSSSEDLSFDFNRMNKNNEPSNSEDSGSDNVNIRGNNPSSRRNKNSNKNKKKIL